MQCRGWVGPGFAQPRVMNRSTAKKKEFEQIAMVWRSELLGQAMAYTRDREEADDLVQETLLKAYTAWHSFERGTSCRRWLHRILRNTFLSRCRRWSRETRWLADRGGVVASLHAGQSLRSRSTPEKRVAERILKEDVGWALSLLSEEFRQVLELHCVQGKRYREIADLVDCPVGTVMSRVYRARKQLKEILLYKLCDEGGRRVPACRSDRVDEPAASPVEAHLIAA